MPYASEYETIANHFANSWGISNGGIPIAWGNVPFSPPDPPSPWVRLTVINGESRYMSAGSPGSNVVRYVGTVIVQVFVPLFTGETACRILADQVAEIFRGKRLDGGIVFGAVSMVSVNVSIAQGWLQVNVGAPFTRDEFE